MGDIEVNSVWLFIMGLVTALYPFWYPDQLLFFIVGLVVLTPMGVYHVYKVVKLWRSPDEYVEVKDGNKTKSRRKQS